MQERADPAGGQQDNPYGYPRQVWRLFREAPGAGAWPPATPGVLTGEAQSRGGGQTLRLQLRCEGGQVREARFQAYGCPYTIALGAWLSENLPGRRLDELAGWTASKMRAVLEMPEDKAHCAFLGEDALKSALSTA